MCYIINTYAFSKIRQKAMYLLDQLSPEKVQSAVDFLSYLASQEIEEPSTFDLMLVSESVLAKDWLKPEEDEAWQNL